MADIKNRIKMPELTPEYRVTCFAEVALGYDQEMAKAEASRCLHCKSKPCITGCPVGVQIPDFIKQISEGNYIEAAEIIKKSNSFPAICGRVCPQENQCEGKCVRGVKGEPVAIGKLERFAADYMMNNSSSSAVKTVSAGAKRVAVIGSGPAGLSCAGSLAKKGFDVTVFEAFHKAGGVLVYGIPEFRLPKDIVAREIAELETMGVKIEKNMVIGKILTVDELFEDGFSAVFIGSGAGLPNFMGIPGENLNGIVSANEFLTRVNLMKGYLPEYDTPLRPGKTVAVIGGGNVAMDAARCAKRLGTESVYIIYRRSEAELPARREEVHHAKEEGIEFKMLCAPLEFFGDDKGNLTSMRCIEMELGEPDASGRRRPIEKAGSEFILDIDTAIIAIGTTPNSLIKDTTSNLDTDRKGCIITHSKSGETSRRFIYAGGDAVTGAATVILAMGAGKDAADAIAEALNDEQTAND